MSENTNERYQVKKEPSVIGKFFQVYDGWQGLPVGKPEYFKDDADRIANKMNLVEVNHEL